MPLEVLIVLVVGGIAGIAGLTWGLGWGTALHLATPLEACAWWDREWPERPARGATLAADGHAALIETAEGPGIVWVMGADCTSRPLDAAAVSATPGGLLIRFHDLAAAAVSVHLDEHSDRAAWAALITEDAPAPREDPAEWAT